tara:strand:- start:943 stop:1329 length:387 start_codon:yes stop_codon:yes gene_type:complete
MPVDPGGRTAVSRIYDSVLMFGITERRECPDPQERLALVYEGKHPLIQQGIACGLDWYCRDMTGYGSHPEGEVLVFVGRKLSSVDVDAPFGQFSPEELEQAVREARGQLAKAGFEQGPAFHHVASHCD